MSYRIAIASSDGKVVNQHFGRADKFYIIDVDDSGYYEAIEIRNLEQVCMGGFHEDAFIHRSALTLSDCNYIIVSRIGDGAANILESHGIKAYVIPDILEAAINKLMAYVEINKMIYELSN